MASFTFDIVGLSLLWLVICIVDKNQAIEIYRFSTVDFKESQFMDVLFIRLRFACVIMAIIRSVVVLFIFLLVLTLFNMVILIFPQQ
jgi:hypothetical protein